MLTTTSRLAKARRQSPNAAGRAKGAHTRLLIGLAALLATGAFASQLVAQSETKMYYSPCGAGLIEVCGEETTYSDCGWSWKGYYLPAFPYVGVIPWYGCETETTKTLYKNYFKSPGDMEEM